MGSDTASVSGSYISTISSSYTATDITSNVASIIACSNDPNNPRVLGTLSDVFAAIASLDVIAINTSSRVAVLAATRPEIRNSRDSLITASEDSLVTNGSQQSSVVASANSLIDSSQASLIAASVSSSISTAISSAIVASSNCAFIFPSVNNHILIGSSSQVNLGNGTHVTVLSTNNANFAGSSVGYLASIASLGSNLTDGIANTALVAASQSTNFSSPFVFSAIACRFGTFDDASISAAIATQSSSMVATARSAIIGTNNVTAGPSFSNSAVVGASSVDVRDADTTVIQASSNINAGSINSSNFTIQASNSINPGAINSNTAASIIASINPQLSNCFRSVIIGNTNGIIQNSGSSMIAASGASSINTCGTSGILFCNAILPAPITSISNSLRSCIIASIGSDINDSNMTIIGSSFRASINQSKNTAVLSSSFSNADNSDFTIIGASENTSLINARRTSAISSNYLTYNGSNSSPVARQLTFASILGSNISTGNSSAGEILAAASWGLNLELDGAYSISSLSSRSGAQPISFNTINRSMIAAVIADGATTTFSGEGLACIASRSTSISSNPTIFSGSYTSSISSWLETQLPNTNSIYCAFISSAVRIPTNDSYYCLAASSWSSNLSNSRESSIVSSVFGQTNSSSASSIDSSASSTISNSSYSSVKSSWNAQLTNSSRSSVICSQNSNVIDSSHSSITSSNNSQISLSWACSLDSSAGATITDSSYSSVQSSTNAQLTTSFYSSVVSSQNSSLNGSSRSAIVSSNNGQINTSSSCFTDSSNLATTVSSAYSSVKSSYNVQISGLSYSSIVSSANINIPNGAWYVTLIGCQSSGDFFASRTVNIGLGWREDNSLLNSFAIGTFNSTNTSHLNSRIVRVIRNAKQDGSGNILFEMNKSPGIGGNPQYVLAVGNLRVLIFDTTTNEWGVAEYAISFYRATNFLGTSLVISNGSGPGNTNPFTINITYNSPLSSIQVSIDNYVSGIQIGAGLDVSFLS
ncbi:MAG: hypothetical protein QW328_06915 [Nitrososphaerota archaeon]